MGNNLCSKLGVTEHSVISRNDFGTLWISYEDENGRLSKEQAKKFLQDFAVANGVNYNDEVAQELINESDLDKDGFLDYHEFQKMFFSMAKTGSVGLTSSLEFELTDEGEITEENNSNNNNDDLRLTKEILLEKPTSASRAGLDALWGLLIEGIEPFFNRSLKDSASTPKQWMALYTSVYSYCSSSASDVVGLYKRLSSFFKTQVTNVLEKIKSVGGSADLIATYYDEWVKYSKAVRKTNRIFKSLDRFVALKLPNQLSVAELSWHQWGVYLMLPLQSELLAKMKEKIKDGPSSNSPSDLDLIVKVLQSCVEMDLDPIEIMKDHFDVSPYLSIDAKKN
jgi:hypothetical protein